MESGLDPAGVIESIQVDGNCCWKAHPKKDGRGKPQHLPLGAKLKPKFQPKSFKKLKC